MLKKINKNNLIICGYKINSKHSFLFNLFVFVLHKIEFILNLTLPSSHNSIIFPCKILKGNLFNEKYICASDFDQYQKIKKFKKISYIKRIIN